MVHPSIIEARLSHLGVHITRWFKAEIRELEHILMDHEEIVAVVPGRYFSGFAILVATDQRLLLIDKRTFFMSLEDIRYDMITEVDYSTRVFDITIRIFTLNKHHVFTSIKYRHQLRHLITYVQRRVTELRQAQAHGQAAPEVSLAQQAAGFAPEPMRRRFGVPFHREVSHRVGSAAVGGAYRFNPNPYVKTQSLNPYLNSTPSDANF